MIAESKSLFFDSVKLKTVAQQRLRTT